MCSDSARTPHSRHLPKHNLSLGTFLPFSCPESVRFLVLDHLITLAYWLFSHLYLILHCNVPGPLASSQALSPCCPEARPQSIVSPSHWPPVNCSALLLTSGHLCTFSSLKEWLCLFPSMIIVQNSTQRTDYPTVCLVREILNTKVISLIQLR